MLAWSTTGTTGGLRVAAGSDGACYTTDNGLCATDGAGDHSNNERCTVVVVTDGGFLSAVGSFSTESCCDNITINVDQQHSGVIGPSGVAVSTCDNFTWASDNASISSGWTVCWSSLAPSAPSAPSGPSPSAPTPAALSRAAYQFQCDNRTEFNPNGGSILRTQCNGGWDQGAHALGLLASRFNDLVAFTSVRGTRIACDPNTSVRVNLLNGALGITDGFECVNSIQEDPSDGRQGAADEWWLRAIGADAIGCRARLNRLFSNLTEPACTAAPAAAPAPPSDQFIDVRTLQNPNVMEAQSSGP